MEVCTYNPNYSGGQGWKLEVDVQLGQKHENLSKKPNYSKKNGMCLK
jgi:hypothetical protein